jgi:hypothetical protein
MVGKSFQQALSAEDTELSNMLDHRIIEMRRMLADMQPGSSAASALRVLRDAFPEASLEERVRALTATRH